MLQQRMTSVCCCWFFESLPGCEAKTGGAISVYPTVHQVLSCMHMTNVWLGWAVFCCPVCMLPGVSLGLIRMGSCTSCKHLEG